MVVMERERVARDGARMGAPTGRIYGVCEGSTSMSKVTTEEAIWESIRARVKRRPSYMQNLFSSPKEECDGYRLE